MHDKEVYDKRCCHPGSCRINQPLFGAVARIALPTLIGDEGVGLYQMAYPVYGMFLVISTAGIPVAVSKLVAEQAAKGNKGAR